MNLAHISRAVQALDALQSPPMFTQRYLPEKIYLEWYHTWDQHIQGSKRNMLLAHPGSGKSTRTTFIDVLMGICENRAIRIGIFSKAAGKAELFMVNVANELMTNQRLINDYGTFFDPRDKLCINNTSRVRVSGSYRGQKEPTITNFGVGTQYESLRLDRLYLDDPVDLKTSRSKVETRRMDDTLGSLIDRLDPNGQLVITGHYFLPGDFYEIVEETRPNINVLKLPAHDEDGKPLAWEIWSREDLEARKRDHSGRKIWEWHTWYMQQPQASEDASFKGTGILFIQQPMELGIKTATMDPAYSDSLANDPDWSVAITGTPYQDGLLITDIEDWQIRKGWARKFCTFAARSGASTAFPEINNAQTLGEEMVEYCGSNDLGVHVEPFKSPSTKSKEYRIGDLADWAAEHQIYALAHLQGKPAMQRLLAQWINYPHVSHEDHLDCLDMLRRKIVYSSDFGAVAVDL